MSSFDTSKHINITNQHHFICIVISVLLPAPAHNIQTLLGSESLFELDYVKHELLGTKPATSKRKTNSAIKEILLQYRLKLG